MAQVIRKAIINDFDKLREVKPEFDEGTLKKRIEMQSKGEAEFLILEVDDKPVSFVLFKWIGKPTHPEYPDIEDLYTKADARGKGYGSILLYECENLAKKGGYNKIGLAVNPDENDNAHRLYMKLGFKDVGESKYLDGIYNGIEDWAIDMEKLIN